MPLNKEKKKLFMAIVAKISIRSFVEKSIIIRQIGCYFLLTHTLCRCKDVVAISSTHMLTSAGRLEIS